ncbi:MAG: iron-containing alcohol dehydrogenase [Candidatus Thiodiazotropha sp. (ex Epidulcina cf. delphinae)]|nr:iron-containing alcohol dehydrogenase [Candidatus Thiodiazotropha sp. (ex Epidulcina cf. delphinae)]
MDNFVYSNPVKYIFGKGQISALSAEIIPYGKRVLFIYGRNHIKSTGLYDTIVGQFQQAGIDCIELGGVQPNPRLSLVREGIDICRNHTIDFILGVGGGSTVDTAKAVSMGAKVDYDIWSAYEDFHNITHGNQGEFTHIPNEAVPMGSVMTKPGTGSGFDYTSVLSNHSTREKLMVINKVMYSKFSIIDPEFGYSLPWKEQAFGIADIMTHVMEQYFTPTKDTDILDQYKEANLRAAITSGRLLQQEQKNYAAQSELFYIASWACSDQSMTGTMGGWDSHMIEHELSGLTDINHGHGMSIVFYGWMNYMLPHLPGKFARFAEKVWGIEKNARSDLEVGREGIEKTAEFWRSLGISLSLSEAGIGDDIIGQAAKRAVRFGPLSVIKPLREEEVREILNSLK